MKEAIELGGKYRLLFDNITGTVVGFTGNGNVLVEFDPIEYEDGDTGEYIETKRYIRSFFREEFKLGSYIVPDDAFIDGVIGEVRLKELSSLVSAYEPLYPDQSIDLIRLIYHQKLEIDRLENVLHDIASAASQPYDDSNVALAMMTISDLVFGGSKRFQESRSRE